MPLGTCQPNNTFIILIRHREESPSSRISGSLSSRRMLIADDVYIGGYVNKPGVAVVFGAEGRQRAKRTVASA